MKSVVFRAYAATGGVNFRNQRHVLTCLSGERRWGAVLRAVAGPGYTDSAELYAKVEFWKNYEDGSGWKERRELSFTLAGNIGTQGISGGSNLFFSAGRILSDPGPTLTPSVTATFPTESQGTDAPEIYVPGGTGALIVRPVMFTLPPGITRIQFDLTAWEETGGGSAVDYVFAACAL